MVSNSGTVNYSSNSVNQYTSVGGANLSYDDNGNLTSENTSLGKSYSYDCENQLISVITPDTCIGYKYDAFGRRVEKTVDDGVTETTAKFIYDGFRVIAEYDGGGTLLRKYVYGPGIDEPLVMIVVDEQTETWYYYHFDDIDGNVLAISDENGQIIESYSYDVYGIPTIYDENGSVISSSAIGNPYLFIGRRYDIETGLYYFRLRYYYPSIGRFLQTDPIGHLGGSNLYAYCHNDPLNYVDPGGLKKHRKGKRPSQRGIHQKGEKRRRQKNLDKKRRHDSWRDRFMIGVAGALSYLPNDQRLDELSLQFGLAGVGIGAVAVAGPVVLAYEGGSLATGTATAGVAAVAVLSDDAQAADDSANDQTQVDAITGASIKAPTKGGKENTNNSNNNSPSTVPSTGSTGFIMNPDNFPEPIKSMLEELIRSNLGPVS